VLPTVGGQMRSTSHRITDGAVLERQRASDRRADQRIRKLKNRLFSKTRCSAWLDVPKSRSQQPQRRSRIAGKIGFPVIIPPSFRSGTGRGIAYNREDVDGSPTAPRPLAGSTDA